MQQHNLIHKIIQINDITEDAIHELLTSNSIIELHFAGMTEKERLLKIKKLYQMAKKEYDKFSPDVFVRKTYLLKYDTISIFAKTVAMNDEDIGKCVTSLMDWYIHAIENKVPVPPPAAHDKNIEYQLKSYRVHNATAIKFHHLCTESKHCAGHVLQALIDQYISQRGEFYAENQTENQRS